MDNIIYLSYILMIVILFWGAKFYGKGTWNEECLALTQFKAIQGFSAICIMLHHIGQKTCAPWHRPSVIVHGLDGFEPIGYYFVGIFLLCSGYGLVISYRKKANYLNGFFGKRILPVIVAFYSTGFIFLVARLLMGEKMSVGQLIIYITGLQLCNPNTWYVIAMPMFYVGFYLCFKFFKKEKTAVWMTCLWIFLYTLLGTFIDHNNWWFRGEWWYNSAHFFSIGVLLAYYEQPIMKNIKKHYVLYMILAFILIPILYVWSERAQVIFSYYGENFNANFKVLRRWACLIAQIGASCAFVFFVFMMGMKVKFGNKVLNFMGSITLEFYLIHGLFVELFGYCFIDEIRPSLYYIRNVSLMVLAVLIPSIPSALLLKKFHKWLVGVLTHKNNKKEKGIQVVN